MLGGGPPKEDTGAPGDAPSLEDLGSWDNSSPGGGGTAPAGGSPQRPAETPPQSGSMFGGGLFGGSKR